MCESVFFPSRVEGGKKKRRAQSVVCPFAPPSSVSVLLLVIIITITSKLDIGLEIDNQRKSIESLLEKKKYLHTAFRPPPPPPPPPSPPVRLFFPFSLSSSVPFGRKRRIETENFLLSLSIYLFF